jgi:20S proteasome subunit beta 7
MSGPVNVGSSVFAFKYKDGVMIAADTAISYGGMLKHKNISRMSALGEETIFSCSGEMADF